MINYGSSNKRLALYSGTLGSWSNTTFGSKLFIAILTILQSLWIQMMQFTSRIIMLQHPSICITYRTCQVHGVWKL